MRDYKESRYLAEKQSVTATLILCLFFVTTTGLLAWEQITLYFGF